MGKDELLAEILRLPQHERRGLIDQAIDSLSQTAPDPDMTPELRAELDRRRADMLAHPDAELTWEEACAELERRRNGTR